MIEEWGQKKPGLGLGFFFAGVYSGLEMGMIGNSQPRAEATFKRVSSWGMTFLLSRRAITDCVRHADFARSFCVIPCLWCCSISRFIILVQFSGMGWYSR